jgi:predicted lipoprotein with Yx(FWY)xxD motif
MDRSEDEDFNRNSRRAAPDGRVKNSHATLEFYNPITTTSLKAGIVPSISSQNSLTEMARKRDATPGKSACNGPCAQNWPPLAVAANAKPMGDWTVVTRDDGSKQWAYKGKPLYTFAKDKKPGDTTGDGFLNNAWHAAKP